MDRRKEDLENDEELVEKATKIQANFRGMKARKELSDAKDPETNNGTSNPHLTAD